MKWQTGISILSLSLASLLLVFAGFNYSSAQNNQSSTIIVIDDSGNAALLDTLLPVGEVGLIEPPAAVPTEAPAEPISVEASTQAPVQTPEPKSPCININTADQSELIKLKGIGPAMSANIINHRTAHGPFKKKEDLMKVKGIGPAKFAGVSGDICL